MHVGAPDLVLLLMRELSLYGVTAPAAHLVEQRRGGRAQPMSADLLFTVTKTTERLVERIFAHRSASGRFCRKQELAFARDLVQVTQDRDGLARERHPVRTVHLHGFGRDPPDGLGKIEFPPAGVPQFARSYEQQRRELEGHSRGRLPAVPVDAAQELPDLVRLSDGRPVSDGRCRQRPAQVERDIPRRPVRGDGVAEDHAGPGPHAPSTLISTSLLERP